jgi:hypothetical protein
LVLRLPPRREHGVQSDVRDFHQQWSWPQPWVRYSELVARGDELARVAEAHRDIWTCAVQRVHDGVAALVVGHGSGIEPALVACFPEADHPRWGALFGHCDGARLGFADGRFTRPVLPSCLDHTTCASRRAMELPRRS